MGVGVRGWERGSSAARFCEKKSFILKKLIFIKGPSGLEPKKIGDIRN